MSMVNFENPIIETLPLDSPPGKETRGYEAQDFRQLYEQEYWAHQETRQKLQRAYDRIDYLEEKVKKLEADLAFMRKLLFSKKTERSKKSSVEDAQETNQGRCKHGAQDGHDGQGRRIPFHLPMQDHVHRIAPEDCFCSYCGLPFKELNTEKVSYEVTVEVRYILFKHRRKKYRKSCQCPQPLVTSPGPMKLFASGLYSMDFWIQVVLDKYAYGMPVERQVKKMAQEGLEISSGVLVAGLLRMAPYLKPLYERMIEKIAFEPLVHADETRWRNWASCYEQERKAEKTTQWLWGVFSERYHVFIIDPSRGAKVLKERLGQGEAKTILPTMVCDRYKSYQALKTLLAYCWAHVRRDFLDIQTKYAKDEELVTWSQIWLNLIGELYALNRLRVQLRDRRDVFEGYQGQIQGVLGRIENLMEVAYTKKPQKAQVESMKNHWDGLTLFLEDPDIPLDNNLAERELRTPVVGRKNFYGTHSDRATEATAIFYSILSTCKLLHIQPKKFLKRYLSAYVQRRGSPMNDECLESFLPHEYAKRYPEDLAQG